MRRFLLALLAVVSAVLTVLSLPSAPEDVAAWSGVLAWVEGQPWRYALPIIGWVGVISLVAWLLYHHHRDGRHSDPAPAPQTTTGDREPTNRAELRGWLDVRIEEIVAWRAVLDEEAAKPVPYFDRTQTIESLFWDGLNRDVARKLQLLAPEWADYWGETPEWYFAPMTRITSEQVAETSRFFGWAAERLRHIKHELP